MKTIKQITAFILALTFVSCGFATIPVSSAKQYTVSEEGISFISHFEGFNEYAYWDYSQYSIGYGTKCNPSDYPNGITESEATLLLRNNLDSYEKSLDGFLEKYGITVNQNQYDALVSITYNLGAGLWTKKADFDLRTMLINGCGNYTEQQIKDAFGQFCRAGGNVLSGLVRRRAAEAELFLSKSSTAFADVPTSAWYYSSVNRAFGKGVFAGTSCVDFSPDMPITRAMAATVLFGMSGKRGLYENAKEMQTEWYSDAVKWALEIGYLSINESTSLSEPITREDFVMLVYKFANKEKADTVIPKLSGYKDLNLISPCAKSAMNWAAGNGIICGSSGYLMPKRYATRAECAAITMALMNYLS